MYLPRIVEGLMTLMAEVDTLESKTSIAKSLNNIILASGSEVCFSFLAFVETPSADSRLLLLRLFPPWVL